MVKKFLRVFFRVVIVLVLLLLFVLIWAVRPVDYTPYFETDYYASTKSRMDSLSKHLTVERGPVLVGFGKQSITPVLNAEKDNAATGDFVMMPLSGYGGRKGTPATGIHDSLFVKAVAIQVQDKLLVIVGSDLLIMPPEVSERCDEILEEKMGITRNNIFYSATHTHSSVGAWSAGTVGELFGGEYNPTVVEWLAQQVADAIILAVDNLKPGSFGVTNFHARDFVRNRLVREDGAVNADFLILKFQKTDGQTAVVGSFDAHATTLGDWNMETSADYPGYFQRKLESEGVDMAVFLAGSVGSHSYQSKGDRFEKSRYLGEALADSVLKYSESMQLKDTIATSSMTLKIDYPEFQVRVADSWRLNPYIAGKLFPEVGEVYLQSLRLGSLVMATTPSDFSGETALVYKNAMYKKGYRAMVTSFNGAYTGYIIPCKYYHLNAYESRLMNWFGPGYNPFVNYLVGEMLDRISTVQQAN